MMTKEEVLNTIIERYKRYKSQEDRNLLELVDCCYKINCDNCPFQSSTDCSDAIAIELLDRLVKAEEHQKAETNLEHYFNVGDVIVYGAQQYIYLNDNCWYAYDKSKSSRIVDWLLSPYEEPPKPKYKLSKFEYDLLKCYSASPERITTHWALCRMHEKGYFKGIPTNVVVADILDDCEVIDGEQKQN